MTVTEINMTLLRLKNGITKFVQIMTVPKRNVSEYAKRFGYKMPEKGGEVKVNYVTSTLCLIGSAVLIADVAMDKQKHYETFMAYYDDKKRYMKEDMRFEITSQPNMDFLVDEFFLPRMGDGNDNPSYVILHEGEEKSPAMLQENVLPMSPREKKLEKIARMF